jgi:hypothetical protein
MGILSDEFHLKPEWILTDTVSVIYDNFCSVCLLKSPGILRDNLYLEIIDEINLCFFADLSEFFINIYLGDNIETIDWYPSESDINILKTTLGDLFNDFK